MAKRNHRSKPRQVPPPPAPFSWKDHPLGVAAGSFAAAIALCVTVFTQIVLPTQTAKLEIEILKLKESITRTERSRDISRELNRKLEASKSAQLREIASLKSNIQGLELEVTALKAGNLFSPGNPYPNGLGLVRIGMPREQIYQVFRNHEISVDEEDSSPIRVKLTNSPFTSVSYFLDDDKKSISHVSFSMGYFNSKYPASFLRERLVENFGQPADEAGNKQKKYKWEVGKLHWIFTNDDTSFVLMKRGDEPLFWLL